MMAPFSNLYAQPPIGSNRSFTLGQMLDQTLALYALARRMNTSLNNLNIRPPIATFRSFTLERMLNPTLTLYEQARRINTRLSGLYKALFSASLPVFLEEYHNPLADA